MCLIKNMILTGMWSYNIAKYINHSCEPNCEVDIIRGRIWIIALRDIQKNEELFYNYGYDMDTYHEHPCFAGLPVVPALSQLKSIGPKLKKDS